MNWLPLTVILAVVLGFLAGRAVPAPDHELGFAGTPTGLRILILTDMTLVISVWSGLMNHLNRKAFPFQMTLPLSSRQIWTARMLAIMTAMFAPLLIATAIFVAISGDYYSPSFHVWLRFVLVLALLPIAVHALGSLADRNFGEVRTPLWFVAAGAMLLVQWLVIWQAPPTWITALAVLAVCALLTLFTLARLPGQFQWRQAVNRLAGELPLEKKKSSDVVSFEAPRWLQIPIVSPWAALNRYLAPDSWVRANVYLVMVGGWNMVWSSRFGPAYSLFLLTLLQALFVVFAIGGMPRLAFLPIPKWRLFLQGTGQGMFFTLICLLSLFAAGDTQFPTDDWFGASTASGVLLWFMAWFVATTAAVHTYLAYPRRFGIKALSWGLKILHWLVAAVFAVFAMSGGQDGWSFDIEILHQWTQELLPTGVLAWIVVVPIIAAFYWVALRLFSRIQLTKLQDRLVKAK